ncbi:MAG: hypothetical protein AB1758_13805 [Candidatus Eremiobacterota bacterium]
MITSTVNLAKPQPAASQNDLYHSPPPGAACSSTPADRVEVGQRPVADGEDPGRSLSWGKKATLAVCLGLSGFGGMLATATSALAAEPALVATADQATPRVSVILVPHGTPRVDVIPRTHIDYHDHNRVRYEDYAEVGVYLGDGLFHDANGNLSYLPTAAQGWNPVIDSFKKVDMEIHLGRDKSAERFGNTVHFNESSTYRHVFTERNGNVEQLNSDESFKFEVVRGAIKVTGPSGLGYDVIRENGSIVVAQAGREDIVITPGDALTRIAQGKKLLGRVTVLDEGRMRLEGIHGKSTVMRSAGGAVLDVDGGLGQDFRLTRDGGVIHTEKFGGDHKTHIDTPEQLAEARQRFQEILDHLEAVEPGYAQKHPLIVAILEYAAFNPGMLTDDKGAQNLVQAGTQLATAGGAVKSGVAMARGATALSLAERARALGAAALSAKAGAEAAARAGNLTQAAALANEARALGDKARNIGAEAMETGKHAQNAAKVAQVMLGVAATLEIVDGGWGMYKGYSDKSMVEGAVAVTQAKLDEITSQLTGEDLERAMEDYSKVMSTLDLLQKSARKEIRVGGLKVGCGSMLLIAALMGPKAPVALGAVGIACTAGTSIYQHWDRIESFVTDKPYQEPSILNVLPDSDEIKINLDNRPPGRGQGDGSGG